MLSWLNGRGYVVWRILVALAMAIILSVCGWVFSQVVAFSEKYPTKTEIVSRLDKFENNLKGRMSNLERSNNELKLFLLNYFSSDTAKHSEAEEPKN